MQLKLGNIPSPFFKVWNSFVWVKNISEVRIPVVHLARGVDIMAPILHVGGKHACHPSQAPIHLGSGALPTVRLIWVGTGCCVQWLWEHFTAYLLHVRVPLVLGTSIQEQRLLASGQCTSHWSCVLHLLLDVSAVIHSYLVLQQVFTCELLSDEASLFSG